MPFLIREVPAGGRHVARPVAAPTPPATTRLRQLLPVGLLVAASSAGAAMAPMLEGSATAHGANGEHATTAGGTGGDASQPTLAGVPLPPMTTAAYALPTAPSALSSSVPTGKHRAAGAADIAPAGATGGKHRSTGHGASGSSGSSGSSGNAAGATSSSASALASSPTPSDTSRSTTAGSPTAQPTAPSSSSSTTTDPTGAATPSSTPTASDDLLGTVTGTVTGVVGGLLPGN